MTRQQVIAVVSVIAVTATYPISQIYQCKVGAYRVELCGTALHRGMHSTDTTLALSSDRCRGLARSDGVTRSGSFVQMRSPIVFGAGNWILRIEFENDVVVAVRYHTADSVGDHPPGAPPDDVTE